MTSNKNVWIAMIVVAIIAVSGLFFPQIQKGYGLLQSAPDVTTTNFTSLSVQNGESNGGLYTSASRVIMKQATSTLCAIQSPNATSTLTMSAVNLTSSASYATVYELAKDPTAFSTTTALVNSFSVAANGTANFVSTTTDSTLVVAPSTWINFSLSTSSASATFTPVGTCDAEFQVI